MAWKRSSVSVDMLGTARRACFNACGYAWNNGGGAQTGPVLDFISGLVFVVGLLDFSRLKVEPAGVATCGDA